MATDQDDAVQESERESAESEALASARTESELAAEQEGGDGTPTQLGATRYVHAAFMAAGVLIAYLTGKLLTSFWNSLAEWPAAIEILPSLQRYTEDERASWMMLAGAAVGLLAIVQTYRKEHIRRWAGEVAVELSKVTWPTKETVTNGTVVVIVASAVATVYITLLDRFWSFVTNLVYSA
jgi:preprotein translocase subunit SecE